MSYISNPDARTTSSTLLITRPIVVIPQDIYNYLCRIPGAAGHMLDFPFIRNKLSLQDLRSWCSCIKECNATRGWEISTGLFSDLMAPSIPAEDHESLLVLTQITEFCGEPEVTVAKNIMDAPKFYLNPEALLVVMPPGFMTTLWSNKITRDEFVREYIEKAYTVMGDKKVHEMELFSSYVRTMELIAS